MAQRTSGRTLVGRLWTVLLLVVAGVVATVPAAAHASPPPIPCLPPAAGPELNPGSTPLFLSLSGYRVYAPNPYWSVVAVRGSQGYDPDLLVADPSGCRIGSSTQQPGLTTDWVAWNSNSGYLPAGTYPLQVIGHAGNTSPVKYVMQFVRGNQTLPTTIPTTDQAIGIPGDWMVDVRDVYLEAGRGYTFTVTGGVTSFHVLSSNPALRSTWSTTQATSSTVLVMPNPDPHVAQTASLTVYPSQSGWYGALFVRNDWQGAATSVRVAKF